METSDQVMSVMVLSTGTTLNMSDLVTGFLMSNNPYKPNFSPGDIPHGPEEGPVVLQPAPGHVQHGEVRDNAHLEHGVQI